MIEYVIPHNPDDRILRRASTILKNGDLICVPTDTNWDFIACSTKKDAIEKLYKIKKENTQKHFSLLCSDISMASELAIINNQAFKYLKKCIPGHYTFIFEATKKMAKMIKASKTDKEVGIRFIPSTLINKLIQIHGQALVSTNLPDGLINKSTEEDALVYSYQFEDNVNGLTPLIIDPGEISFAGPSTIVDFSSSEIPVVIREGSGDSVIFE